MKKSALVLLALGVAGVFYAAEAQKAAPVTTPKATPVRSSALKAEMLTRSLLGASKGILSKAATKQDYSTELATILNAGKDLDKEKLKAVAALAQQYATLKANNASPQVLTHVDEQRRELVARYNEISRLLELIDSRQGTPVFLEKVADLVVFLEPPQDEKTEAAPLTRRAPAGSNKNSTTKPVGKPAKK